MSVRLQEVWPTIVVVIDKTAAPGDVLIVDAHARGKGLIGERSVAVVVIEVRGIVGKVSLEDVEPAVAIVVAHRDAHSRLFVPILVVGGAGYLSNIGERAIVVVVEQYARFGIHGHKNIRPAVVIKIVGDSGDRISRAGFQNACLFGNVRERAVAIVVEEDVCVPGKTPGAAHDRDTFPLAGQPLAGCLGRVELDVVADKKIQMPVAVIIEPGTACAPANPFVVNAGLAGHIGECAVAVVVEQDVVSPEATEQIIPAVVVKVAYRDAGLPSRASDTGLLGYVRKRSVAVVLVKLRGWSTAARPVGVEASAVAQINVQPAVIVVVEESKAATFGFDDERLMFDATPHIRSSQARFPGHVHEGDRRRRRGTRDALGLEGQRASPFPEGHRERIEQVCSQTEQGRAKETPPRESHGVWLCSLGKARATIPVPSLTAMT